MLSTLELKSAARAATAATADLTVVGGAGHVGIPLVLSFAAKGMTVNVNDTNEAALNILRSGRVPYIEEGAEVVLKKALADNLLFFTSQPSDISKNGPVIITIGTPVDEFLNPVRAVIRDSIDALLPHLVDGQLLVLRSTLYPGTTDWVDTHIKNKGREIQVAFCPERIVQGHGMSELNGMPQLLSATSPEAEREVTKLFGMIAPEVVPLKPIEAEFAKLFTNAFRYTQFAITNQFYLIAKSAGLDYGRILQAMKRNYPRAAYIPGPGFAAGPCLVKDTMQLLAFARNEFALGNAAIMVNEGLPLHIIADLRRSYDLSQHDRRPSRHGIQGRERRCARVAELQAEESLGRRRSRCPRHRSLRHRRSRFAAARRGHRAQRSTHSLHAARHLQSRRSERQAAGRRLGPAAGRHPCRLTFHAWADHG